MDTEDTRTKIVIIGPVYPFRGGIAQHTTKLSQAIDKSFESLVISFSRLYPKWLYPGQSDRDLTYSDNQNKNTKYIIDSLNPFTWLKAIRVIENYSPSVVVIPWWTFFLSPCLGFISKRIKSKTEVVFFCHNVSDHESSYWKTILAKIVLKNASRYVVQSKKDASRLKSIFPGACIKYHSHPIYNQFPLPNGSSPKRSALELLFFGFVRPYKGLDDLIDALTILKNQDIYLTVAGEFWTRKDEILNKIERFGLSSSIEIRARYHADEEIAELFNRADVVILPYHSATGSGVITIAYHYNKPVIVTNVGGLPDEVLENETGWVVEPNCPNAIASAISKIDREQCVSMETKIQNYKKNLTWGSLAQAVIGKDRVT